MNIKIELFGDQIGVDGNLARLIEKKECQILMTIYSDHYRNRYEVVLNREQCHKLMYDLHSAINNPILEANGFKVV